MNKDLTRRDLVLRAGAGAVAVAFPLPAFAQSTPVKGGRLTSIVNPEPPNLIVGLAQLGPTYLVGGKIFQSLLNYDFQLNPVPRLAESWEISPDGLTYKFNLRKNVRWHDGAPFTANDVVFSITEFLMTVNSRAKVIFSRCSSIAAPDDHTVVFTLKEPFSALILAFDTTTAPILPAHIYKGTNYAQNPMNATPIGTGPFKFKEWKRGQYIHLVRNDDYWRPGQPYLDELLFLIIPDGATRAIALESGQVQLTSSNDLEFVDIKRLSALPNIGVEERGFELFAPTAILEMNERVGPFADRRFRQAIMYAVDRDFIKNNIWYGFGKVPTGPIGSRTRFYDPNVRIYNYNPQAAIKLLDEMGLKPGADGVRAQIRLLQLPYGETWTRTGEYIKQALQRVGVRVDIDATDAGSWAKRLGDWEFQTSLNFPYQLGDPALGVSRTYLSTNIKKGIYLSNMSGYVNHDVDRLLEKAATAVDPAERQKLYSEMQRLVVEDVPVGWMLEITFPTLFSKKLHNVVTTAIGVAGDFEDTWLERS